MANTIGTQVWREKYAKATLENALRNNTVAEAICKVDRSDAKVIKSPYMTAPTVTVQALTGTYTPATFTTTNDTLTVTDEFIVSEHIMDFESTLADFDLFAGRMDDMMANVAIQIDRFVLNNLCEDGTGTYTTPAGGFTTAANINQIFGDLVAKVAGYSDAYNNLFLVIENTDLPGLMVAGATNGFTVADQTIKNGKVGSWMGVDIYVVRSSTFASETLGTTTYTNSGHRVFGVKGVATYAAPRGIQYEEKQVTGKTGKEIVVYGYIGFKLWTPKAALIVDITLA